MSGSLDWSVRIVSVPGGAAAFQPRVPRSRPGDPLKAQVGDIITWGNATGQIHQPWPTEGNQPNGAPAASNPPGSALFFSEPISGNGSSSPQFVVPAELPAVPPATQATPLGVNSVINYCCKNHPTERGQIVIF